MSKPKWDLSVWDPSVSFNFGTATESQKAVLERENRHCEKFFRRPLPREEETGWHWSYSIKEVRID